MTAIDDALVVHRCADSRFQFAMLGITKLGLRSYATWFVTFLLRLDRWTPRSSWNAKFPFHIERPAGEHVFATGWGAVALAVQTIAGRRA